MDPADLRIILSTAPPDEAESLACALLERRLIACANVLPGRSHYWWNGTIEHGEESMLVMKAPKALVSRVVDAIREQHRYETPEILVLPVEGGSEAYARWVGVEATGTP